MDNRTDTEIIRLVLNGQVRDFRHLIERHTKMAYKTAFAVTRNHEDAQEIVQDAFMKAFSSLDSFQGKSKFATWLYRIIYYTALNKFEKSKSYKSHIELGRIEEANSSSINDSWDLLVGRDRIKYIGKALDRLSPEDRMALSLYYLDELPQQDISLITGWSLSSTKLRIHRARAKLDRILKTILDTDSLL